MIGICHLSILRLQGRRRRSCGVTHWLLRCNPIFGIPGYVCLWRKYLRNTPRRKCTKDTRSPPTSSCCSGELYSEQTSDMFKSKGVATIFFNKSPVPSMSG